MAQDSNTNDSKKIKKKRRMKVRDIAQKAEIRDLQARAPVQYLALYGPIKCLQERPLVLCGMNQKQNR